MAVSLSYMETRVWIMSTGCQTTHPRREFATFHDNYKQLLVYYGIK